MLCRKRLVGYHFGLGNGAIRKDFVFYGNGGIQNYGLGYGVYTAISSRNYIHYGYGRGMDIEELGKMSREYKPSFLFYILIRMGNDRRIYD